MDQRNILKVDSDLPFLIGLTGLATKWYDIGVNLGVPVDHLEVIQEDNSGRVDRTQNCLREMFKWWLRNGREKTVEKLIEAVHAVGKQDAEEEIMQKYGIHHRSALITEFNLPVNVQRYCRDMKTRYLQQSVLPESDWPPSLGGQYVRLCLITQRRQLSSHRYEDVIEKQKDYTRGDYDKILANKTEIELNTAFDKVICEGGNEVWPLKLLIDGAPGVGKTTLSRKVSCMWAKSELLKEYWLVLLLHLRENTISKAKTVDDFFYHEDSDLQCDVVKFVKDRSGDGVLIIFDGFDELSTYERSEESLFLRIIEGKILPKCAVVVTSRPYASRPLLDLQSIGRHIEILGFKNEQINSCIRQKVRDEVKAEALCSELKDRLDVASICQIPLNCSIVLYVYEQENYSLPCTLTKLYDLFILHSLKRFIRRTQNSRAADKLSYLARIPDPSREHFKSLCYLAYKGLKEDKIVFTRDDVEEVFPAHANYDQELDLPVLDLMTVAKSYSSRGAHDTYSFLHLTIEEFLCAYWITHHSTDIEKLHFFQEHLMDSRFRMVLLFLSGLTELRFPDAHSIFSKDLCFVENVHICHLLYESGNSSILKYLSETCVTSKSVKLYGSRFDALVMAHFIAYSGDQWDQLELRPEDVKSVSRKFSNPESVNTSIKEIVIKFCPLATPEYHSESELSILADAAHIIAGINKLSQDLTILELLDELTQITRITVGVEIRERNFHSCQALIETLHNVFVGPHSVHRKCYTIMLGFLDRIPSRIENQSANYCNSKTKLCETLAECLAQNGFITHVALTSVTVNNVSCIFTRLSREDSKSNLAYFQCQVCNSQIPFLALPVPMDFLTSLLSLISANKSIKELNLDVPNLDVLVSSQIMALKTVLISNTTLQRLTMCKGLYEFKRNLVTNEMELTNPPMIANLPLKNIASASPITDVSDEQASSPPQAKRPRK